MATISDKKLAIFKSMEALIKDHGFHGAPMSMVAKNAGVAAGTVYHYFESKEQLISELYTYNRRRIIDIVESAIDNRRSYEENFFSIWTSLYNFYTKHSNVLIFFEQFVNSPYNIDRYPNYFRGQLYDFFKEGIKSKLLKTVKPEILVVLTLANIASAAKLNLIGNIRLNKNDLQQIRQILWRGMVNS